MTDQNSQFFAMLTAVGEAKQANADALGIAWKITQMGVGDANGTEPIPNRLQTTLLNERRRAPLNQLKVDPSNASILIAEQVIPEDVGGWWIREIGLYDETGALVAIANCAPSFKPQLSQGSGRTQVVRMNFIVSSAANVELKIDPSVVLATRKYVDDELAKLDHKQSVRYATTAAIALAGLAVQEGGDWAAALTAGDRVLVKNQAAGKDNGLYAAAAGAWLRVADADGSPEVTSGLVVAVEQGTTLADTRWQLVTDGAIVLGTTALVFQNVTQGFAPLSSPAFTDNPTCPTPPQFDNDASLANTAHVQRALGSIRDIVAYPASQVISAADVGKLVLPNSAGAITLTLPLASSLVVGATIHFRNAGAGLASLVCSGADIFYRAGLSAPYSTLKLAANDSVSIVASSTGWELLAGSAALRASTGDFAASIAAAGYEKLPSGKIVQWGWTAAAGAGDLTQALPIPFPNEFLHVFITQAYTEGTGSIGYAAANPAGLANFVWRGSPSGNGFRFWAVGR